MNFNRISKLAQQFERFAAEAPKYIEKKASSNHTIEAMDSLVKAAEIFENLHMFVAAKAVTKIIEQIPAKVAGLGPIDTWLCECKCDKCIKKGRHDVSVAARRTIWQCNAGCTGGTGKEKVCRICNIGHPPPF